MPSRDILDRLFEVEKKAEALVGEASAEAASRVSAAKEKADIEFKSAYEAAAKATEEWRLRDEGEADASHEAAVAAYRQALAAARLDRKAFAEACERYLSGIA